MNAPLRRDGVLLVDLAKFFDGTVEDPFKAVLTWAGFVGAKSLCVVCCNGSGSFVEAHLLWKGKP